MRTSSDITVTDQFCGAGGSSQGAQGTGARAVLAMNHWKNEWLLMMQKLGYTWEIVYFNSLFMNGHKGENDDQPRA